MFIESEIQKSLGCKKILFPITYSFKEYVKGTVMQTEKALIDDRLSVSKASCKFRIPTIYNFANYYRENYYFLKKWPTF